jgi:hypothetical protein
MDIENNDSTVSYSSYSFGDLAKINIDNVKNLIKNDEFQNTNNTELDPKVKENIQLMKGLINLNKLDSSLTLSLERYSKPISELQPQPVTPTLEIKSESVPVLKLESQSVSSILEAKSEAPTVIEPLASLNSVVQLTLPSILKSDVTADLSTSTFPLSLPVSTLETAIPVVESNLSSHQTLNINRQDSVLISAKTSINDHVKVDTMRQQSDSSFQFDDHFLDDMETLFSDTNYNKNNNNLSDNILNQFSSNNVISDIADASFNMSNINHNIDSQLKLMDQTQEINFDDLFLLNEPFEMTNMNNNQITSNNDSNFILSELKPVEQNYEQTIGKYEKQEPTLQLDSDPFELKLTDNEKGPRKSKITITKIDKSENNIKPAFRTFSSKMPTIEKDNEDSLETNVTNDNSTDKLPWEKQTKRKYERTKFIHTNNKNNSSELKPGSSTPNNNRSISKLHLTQKSTAQKIDLKQKGAALKRALLQDSSSLAAMSNILIKDNKASLSSTSKNGSKGSSIKDMVLSVLKKKATA